MRHVTVFVLVIACAFLASLTSGSPGEAGTAILLDDFNDNIKTAWQDTANGGSITESNQQFRLKTLPVNQIIYLIGLVVVVLAVLAFFGLR